MDTMFTNSPNSKASDPHSILLNLEESLNL